MSASRHADRSSNLRIRPELKPPRTWAAMLDAWGALLTTLCSVLGVDVASVDPVLPPAPHLGFQGPDALHIVTWRWMWSLPPCSEARKAAHTLGHAALLIERWRSVSEKMLAAGAPFGFGVGQAAESMLRIADWHIDDARGEAHARTLGIEPIIPPHERVYERDAEGHARVCGEVGRWLPDEPNGRARAILADHFSIPRPSVRASAWMLGENFAETAIASLPDGPWVMTSQDVSRFLDMILEGPWTRTGQDGEPVRDVTAAEYEEHCKRHEPPPLGCERHHPDGERCCDTCAFPGAT